MNLTHLEVYENVRMSPWLLMLKVSLKALILFKWYTVKVTKPIYNQ